MSNLQRIFFIIIFIISNISIVAQTQSGPVIGISNSWLHRSEVGGNSYGTQYGEKIGDWKNQITFNVGYQFLFHLKNNFTLNASLLYQSRGIHVDYNRTTEDRVNESKRFNSMSVNGIFNYNILKKIPVGIGIEPAFYFNTHIGDNLEAKREFDIPLVLKVGYTFQAFELALSYKHGFNSIYRDGLVSGATSRDIQLSIFYPIPF